MARMNSNLFIEKINSMQSIIIMAVPERLKYVFNQCFSKHEFSENK